MENNAQIVKNVKAAIKWKPLLSLENIEVKADNGVVSLSGTVDSYVKKMDAEKTTSKVRGVHGIVGNIIVVFPETFYKSNIDLAQEAISFLDSNSTVPQGTIKVKVEDGWVTLDGEVSHIIEKEAAFEAIHYITGIKGITNNIKIVTPKIELTIPSV